jgi:hypothetical protein
VSSLRSRAKGCSWPVLVHRLWLVACLLGSHGWPVLGTAARAQTMPDPGRDLELIESTERSEDPLGLDESTGKELDRAASRIPKAKPVVILPSASRGAALSSIAGVRESAHAVTVRLEQGLAFVKLRLSFVSTAKHAAEIAYRLPLPTSAVVTRLARCEKLVCHAARPMLDEATEARAHGHESPQKQASIVATPIVDGQGRALALRLVPIAAQGVLSVEVEYVAEAPWRDGRARFRLEPRGYDPNLAPTVLHVEAPRMTGLKPAGEQQADAWTALEVSASLPDAAPPLVQNTSAPCGAGRCTRRFSALARAAPTLRPTWLFIDASPSMEGPARSRMSSVLAALLTVLPEATDVRALAFAARASELGRFSAGTAPLLQLSDATMLDLDAATLPSAALSLTRAEVARQKPRIVVLSDGLFDTSAREREALASARRQGAETWLLLLGEPPARLAETFSHVVELAALSDSVAHAEDLSALEDALRVVAAKGRSDGQRAGAQRVLERRPARPWVLSADSHWLSYWMRRDGIEPSFRTAPSDSAFIAALPYESVAPPAPVADTGLPKESVLSMLRTQLVPQARACLRTDRKGRADYAVGLAFHALFAQREVYEGRVEGSVPRALRACLEAILPRLRVPAFSGGIRIRYPIYTEREAEPPVIELEPELGKQLERAFSPARALP